jgi:Serine acetyltransferase|tara:strand:- start:780 stop:1331 length:552 start_codon:yes stop_codon:yes gene_type:complete
MKSALHYDFYRLIGCEPTIKGYIKALWIPGFRYLFILRLIQSSQIKFVTSFLKLILRHYQFKFGYQIHPSTKIGRGFIISHYGTIIINSNAIIGENCNVNAGVIIGSAGRDNKKGVPKLSDRVWVGSNAIIVGGVTIGNDTLIAPGTFVNRDIPDHSLAFGNPCIVKYKKYASKDYISHVYKT